MSDTLNVVDGLNKWCEAVATVHITKTLQKKLDVVFDQSVDPNDAELTVLKSFSAKDFMLGRFRLVMAINHDTRLVLLIKLAPKQSWLERLGQRLEGVLVEHGVPSDQARSEAEGLKRALLAPNRERSLLGTLNDLVSSTQSFAPSRPTEAQLLELQWRLNQTPHVNREPVWPKEAIRQCFGLNLS